MSSRTPQRNDGSADETNADVDPRVVDLLSSALSEEGAKPERIDTHGALVLLGRKAVFKIKRRKRFPYMDFSTLAARARASAAEVRLNRRTAPEFYLGLRPVLEKSDGLHLGALQSDIGPGGPPDGPPGGPRDTPAGCIEWVVVMKPFDGTRLLSKLAADGALPPSMLRQLADRVYAFHAAEHPARSTQAEAIQAVIDGNIDELSVCKDLDAEDRRRLAVLSRDRLDRLKGRLDSRAAEGHVRHCHGDLHLGNVVATDAGPMPFDALEFDEELATIDTAYDTAFLLMDLDRFGLRDGANAFFNRSLDQSADYGSLGPLPLFLSMRAAIRAKIGISAAATQTDRQDADAKRAEAADYLRRSVDYLSPPDPIVIAIGGLSGTGKTSVANAVAPEIGAAPGAVVLRSDVIRKRMAGVPETASLDSSWYTAEISTRIYEEMAETARKIVADGHSVIFDAVAAKPDERDLFEASAGGHPFVGLWLTADPDLLKSRVTERRGDASDATAAVVEHQTQYDLGALRWPTIQADDELDKVVGRAKTAIGRATEQ